MKRVKHPEFGLRDTRSSKYLLRTVAITGNRVAPTSNNTRIKMRVLESMKETKPPAGRRNRWNARRRKPNIRNAQAA